MLNEAQHQSIRELTRSINTLNSMMMAGMKQFYGIKDLAERWSISEALVRDIVEPYQVMALNRKTFVVPLDIVLECDKKIELLTRKADIPSQRRDKS